MYRGLQGLRHLLRFRSLSAARHLQPKRREALLRRCRPGCTLRSVFLRDRKKRIGARRQKGNNKKHRKLALFRKKFQNGNIWISGRLYFITPSLWPRASANDFRLYLRKGLPETDRIAGKFADFDFFRDGAVVFDTKYDDASRLGADRNNRDESGPFIGCTAASVSPAARRARIGRW